MGKRLALFFAMMVMLIPVAGHALGLGNITMNSALNQPLDAEIELLSVQGGDLDGLAVRLGSEEDFQRVGADRVFFLTKIQFEVIRRENNTAFVKLTTSAVVNEPFLDFVVEARWPRGRILREFTVLVDPPVLSEEAPAPVQQPAVMAPPAPAMAAATQPSISPSVPPSVVSQRQAPIRERAELTPVMRRDGEIYYGPVKHSDTLYKIAAKLRPSGVTVNQMMIALVLENPNAFYNDNINQLKAGHVLRVDDPSVISALSAAEAQGEVQRQHLEWQARKSGKLVRQTDVATAGGRVSREGAATPSGAATTDQARLKLVAPGAAGAGSGAGEKNVDQLRQDLLLAAEALDANRQETEELKSRLTAMEEQLEAMQRLIMLKDDEMLALQKQSGQELADSGAPEATEAAAMDAKPEGEQAAAVMPAPKPAPAPVPAPMPEPGLLDDPMVLYGGIGVLLLLVVVALIQRRRRSQDGFEESILNVGSDGDAATVGATAETMAQGGESSMVSDFALSEMSGMSGIQTDIAEVDPISEADVYLAYGRHQQAEDILNEALEADPGRHEIMLKLLEVFFAAKNRESFELRAQELHDALSDESDPLWAKAVTMGGQLCPGSELFGGTSAEALQEELAEGAGENDEDLLDFDFDLDTGSLDTELETGDAETDELFAELEAATSGDAAVTKPASGEDGSLLDFDLDVAMEGDAETAAKEATTEPVVPEKEKSADTDLDFDVSSLDFSLDQDDTDTETLAEITAETEVTAETKEDTGLDFDLESFDEGTKEPVAAEVVEVEADGLGEEPSEELSLEGESGEELGEELSLESEPSEELGEELSLEGEPGEELGDDLGDDLGDELDDAFGEVDEVGTKLDLAKAYVDMGDKDGARSILDEVMEEGDEEQKKQAGELLDQLT
jgi:pilus assembly protein FimV